MTGLVDVLRERAGTTVDLDPADVLDEARRRLRRTRLVRGVVTAVAVTAASAVALVVAAPKGHEPQPVATQSMTAPAYSTGAVLIIGDRVVEGGGPVTSFVRVPAGTVWTTGEGRVRLLAPHGREAMTIGTTKADAPHLVADPAHDQVAWVSRPPGSPAFVVYDVAAGTQRTIFSEVRGGRRAADRVRVYGVDGDVLYARDSRGLVQVDLRDESTKVLSISPDDGTIASVAGGMLAWRSPVPSKGYVVGPRYGDGVPTGRRSRPMLSTGGTYLSTDDDAGIHVQRTSDGSVVTPRLEPSYTRAVAYAWSDDDHLLVAGVTSRLDGRRVVDLVFLTCAIDTGRCEVTGEGHSYPGTLDLPVGEPASALAEALRR
ncbi:hypothetical protein [Nocardioides marmoribigeumensis]|uniref:WD40 repeat domain-containing protein n=1 Tax=Nocardioides marmoribigeumensis TaxID=433649 RepID=A0ABU2BVX4_9ACTN|nr:hypothetical protein [Nocardioides marmoribigeumensis]MDR7362775.1 hypothetical protein [Nocardioides marmoribigeumensis]